MAARRGGYSHREIAVALGITKTAVGRRLAKAGAGAMDKPRLDPTRWFETLRDWAISVAEYAEEQRELNGR